MFSIQSLASYEYRGSCYFLSVRHPSLSEAVQTLSEPTVMGNAGDIQAGFLVFLGRGQLTFECHAWGAVDVPANFREFNVAVSAPPVSFVALRLAP